MIQQTYKQFPHNFPSSVSFNIHFNEKKALTKINLTYEVSLLFYVILN